MPGSGPHRWYFAGKTPWIAGVLVLLLLVNTLAGVVALPLYEHFAHRNVLPPSVVWLDEHFIATQFILLALVGFVFVIYRKDVRYERRGWKQR